MYHIIFIKKDTLNQLGLYPLHSFQIRERYNFLLLLLSDSHQFSLNDLGSRSPEASLRFSFFGYWINILSALTLPFLTFFCSFTANSCLLIDSWILSAAGDLGIIPKRQILMFMLKKVLLFAFQHGNISIVCFHVTEKKFSRKTSNDCLHWMDKSVLSPQWQSRYI